MKKMYRFLLASICVIVISVTSCKDEDRVIVPEWESGIHGRTVLSSGSPANFIKGDPTVELDFDLYWNSIDSKNTVTKIEIFVLFNEAYIDADGNPKVAKHGGDKGKLLSTLEGSAVPANRETTSFSISQADLFALYTGSAFDYMGTGAVPVWGVGSIKAERNTTDKMFIDGDAFQVRWAFTTEDGRVFDKWGVSVCTEFPGANCTVNWQAICNPVIQDPEGDYVITMEDSYGDGWNGAAIVVKLNGVTTEYTVSEAQGDFNEVTVTAPADSQSLFFDFKGGEYDSEVTFTITSPKGNVIASGGPSPAKGPITLNLCNE